MPDVKISALPASTTPLAGTEVLPIVQSATTRQVSVANLTAGRAVNALSLTASSLTSGRVTYAGASGLLTDSATLQFNANGLGIGAAPNTSPGSPYFNLNVGGGGGGGIISSGDDTYFTNNLYITGGANYFAVTGPAYGSYYNQSNGNHLWLSSTAAGAGGTVATVTEKARIDTSGNLLVGITTARANAGDVQVSKGISFPATQSAQSDANTLDDYEEGIANITMTSGGGSLGTVVVYAKYVKVGALVTILADITAGTVSSPTGVLKITGLPFSGGGSQADRGAPIIVSRNGFNVSSLGAGTLFGNVSGTEIDLFFMLDSGASRSDQLAQFVASSASFNATIVYTTS